MSNQQLKTRHLRNRSTLAPAPDRLPKRQPKASCYEARAQTRYEARAQGDLSCGALIVNIASIDPEGSTVSGRLGEHEIRQLLSDGDLGLQPGETYVELDLSLMLVQQNVSIEGQLRGQIWVECSRCLSPASIGIEEPTLRRTYLSKAAFERDLEPDAELRDEDLEVSTHDGTTIDLANLVRECLLLAIPIAPLCSQECLGQECPSSTPLDPDLQGEGLQGGVSQGEGLTLPRWKEALQRLKS